MNWEIYPFHTLEYKMLPLSQKINTSEDINIKRYCTNCGAKLSKGHKFCSSCGTKA
jgi:rRNA maturation endonuclease Nob1